MSQTGKTTLRFGGTLADVRGSVAAETALVIPVLLILLYAAVDIGYYLLTRAAVHRATASFAEIVVNEPPILPDANDPADSDSDGYNGVRASYTVDNGVTWLRLVDAMIDNDGDTSGIAIVAQYCIASATAVEDYGASALTRLQAGDIANNCPPASTASALECVDQLENREVAYLNVHVCYQLPTTMPRLSNVVLPTRVESGFLALRKDENL